jgi:hypothetical protein
MGVGDGMPGRARGGREYRPVWLTMTGMPLSRATSFRTFLHRSFIISSTGFHRVFRRM